MRYSRIDAVPHPNYFHYVTSALLIKTDFGPIANVTLEDNYFAGGAYTVYSVGDSPLRGTHQRHHAPQRLREGQLRLRRRRRRRKATRSG